MLLAVTVQLFLHHMHLKDKRYSTLLGATFQNKREYVCWVLAMYGAA
jgi:hypothetical protein